MPYVIDIKHSTRQGSTELASKGKLFIQRGDWSVTYYVIGDSLSDTPNDIIGASGIPPLYYPLYDGYCNKITPKEVSRTKNPRTGAICGLWEVTCEFDTDIDPNSEAGGDGTPDLKPPQWRWTGEQEEQPLTEDVLTGEPVVTGAGEPILITTPFWYPILEIRRYEKLSTWDDDTILDYSNTLNLVQFWGAKMGCARMLPIETDFVETIESAQYVPVTYKIKFKMVWDQSSLDWKFYSWLIEVPHRGVLYRKAPGAEPEPHATAETKWQITEVELNADGTKNTSLLEPYKYLSFNGLLFSNFNDLSLGPW